MSKAEALTDQGTTRARIVPSANGVRVGLLDTIPEFEAAVEVIGRVWGRDGGNQLPIELLRAYAHAGDPVIGAFGPDSDEMIGFCVGFLAAPVADDIHLHSHMTGVVPGIRHRGVGFAMKVAQRDWCLERGISEVRWTVDPMLAANAWFNIVKLGATSSSYLPEFYGEMTDDLNKGEITDRLEMCWPVGSERVESALSGSSVNGQSAVRTVAIPEDYRALRQEDPDKANELRIGVREDLTAAFADGLEISGFSREAGYLLTPRS